MVKLADRFDSWQLIDDDDAALAAALTAANVPALMAALVHVSGDASIIRAGIRPSNECFGDANGDISEADKAKVRAQALELLKAYRDRGCTLPAPPSSELVREMMEFIAGQALPDEYERFLVSELALDGTDAYRQPALEALPAQDKANFHVLIVGAGMSGLLAAYRLRQAGIAFTIVEKNDDVGGTWFENTYPGCRVDSPNHVYSYSFTSNNWPQHFSTQPALLDYFRTCADQMAVREHIRFGTEAVRSIWDEASTSWRMEVRAKDGRSETLMANAIISATGQLNRPRIPEIPGMGRFRGPSWHSARWNRDVDLTGKRIGVVGTGASVFQFVPCIVEQAAQVTIFQRTPPWVSPCKEYYQEISEAGHWLLHHVPFYAKWLRLFMFWHSCEGIHSMAKREPAYNDRDDAVSESNEVLRAMLVDYLKEVLGDRPDLLDKCTPNYPPAGKRMLVDDGTWLRTLKRDDVELVTDPIRELTDVGLVTEAGAAHEFDLIIYGTGFHASKIAWPMEFVGRDGRELQREWGGDPRAYLGITMPGYPNLFMMYGPNTNIVVNGSIVFFSECEMRYILGCLELIIGAGHAAIECCQRVHDTYNQMIDAGNAEMAWGAPNVRSWYKNARGRVTQNWPFTPVEYWQRTRRPDPKDFLFVAPPPSERAAG